jgi:hypothetical protein
LQLSTEQLVFRVNAVPPIGLPALAELDVYARVPEFDSPARDLDVALTAGVWREPDEASGKCAAPRDTSRIPR